MAKINLLLILASCIFQQMDTLLLPQTFPSVVISGGCPSEERSAAIREEIREGLQSLLNDILQNVDECVLGTANCTHYCQDTVGSYLCSCDPGFMLDNDGFTCSDADECAMNYCQQQCINTVGSFECFCNESYRLNSDGVTCTELQTGDVRLIGGIFSFEGRVEIYVNGTWGTVCHDRFGTEDAAVLCRQLGLETLNAIAYGGALYGQGTGPIWLEELACVGSEDRIIDCSHPPLGTHNCDHIHDVGVICILPDAYPAPIGDVRLVGGVFSFEGRLEIFVNDTWGTVCHDRFGTEDAMVVCRQLGLETSNAVAYGGALYGQGTGPIWLEELACSGSEDRIIDCSHPPLGTHNCDHIHDVGVICIPDDAYPPPTGDVRLVGGVNNYEGRLEIFVNDTWGTVCSDRFGNEEAMVVCRQLGLETTNAAVQGYGPGTGPIWLEELGCSGSEDRVIDCPHPPLGTHNCAHIHDIGVSCPPTS